MSVLELLGFNQHCKLEAQDLLLLFDKANSSSLNLESLAEHGLNILFQRLRLDLGSIYWRRGAHNIYKKSIERQVTPIVNYPITDKHELVDDSIQIVRDSVASRHIQSFSSSDPSKIKHNVIPYNSAVRYQIIIPLCSEYTSTDYLVTGLIVITRFSNKQLATHELEFLNVIANLLSVLAGKYFALERRTRRSAYLESISNLDASDFDSALQVSLQSLAKLVPIKFSTLWLYNEVNNSLALRTFHPAHINGTTVNFDSFDATLLHQSTSLSGGVAINQEPRVFENLDNSKQFANPNFAKRNGLTWFVSFPITSPGHRSLGILNLWPDGNSRDFGSESIRIISTYITPLANVVRIHELQNLSTLIFSYDLAFKTMISFARESEAWDDIAQQIREQMRCEACSIFRVNSKNLLELVGTTGIQGSPPTTR